MNKAFVLHLFQLEMTGTAIWINPFIGILTIISLWPVAIIFMNVNSHLRSINLVPKYAIYQVSQYNQHLKYTILNFLSSKSLGENQYMHPYQESKTESETSRV